MRKKIFVDFDDTLVDFAGQMIRAYNLINTKRFSLNSLTSSNFRECLGLSEKELSTLYEEMKERGLWGNYNLLDGVKNTMNNFKNYSWNILTAREEKDMGDISETIYKERINIDNIYRVERCGYAKAKAEIALKQGADFIIEDNPFFAVECSKGGLSTFMISKPWNKKTQETENLIKVSNWLAIGEYLK